MSFQGKAIIFCAPSGSGKTTIARYLLNKFPDQFGFSVSATNRGPRSDKELHGRDYYFISTEAFKDRIHANDFVEWEEVYAGTYYGTLKEEVERLWNRGKHIVFDVDVKGGLKLKEYFEDKALSIFVLIDSIETLEKRLRLRQTETEEQLKRRLAKAEYELSFKDEFDILLPNDDLGEACQNAERIVMDFVSR